MFTENRYYHKYMKIIENAKSFSRSKTDGYYERHHIIPKSCGGIHTKSNLVLLTLKEHFVCHWLLTKCMSTQHLRIKMFNALSIMSMGRKLSALEYSKTREAFYKARHGNIDHFGEKNPMFGKTHSEETKKKISAVHKGKIMSFESRQKMSVDFTFISPDGTIVSSRNITQFCKDNKLDRRSIYRVISGKYSNHKGWKSVGVGKNL